MAQDLDVNLILDLIVLVIEPDPLAFLKSIFDYLLSCGQLIIEYEPLGLLKSLFKNLVYFGELIELDTQELFIAIRANKLLHIIIFYSLALWLFYIFLFPKQKTISITHVRKDLTKESQEALMKKLQSKNQFVKAMLENLKESNDTKKPNEILKKIDQAINEIKILQDYHNEFKGEIIDSHNQIIESLKPNRTNYYKEAEEPGKKLKNEQEDWGNIEKFEVNEDENAYDGEKELISIGKNEDMAEDGVKTKDFDIKIRENDIGNSSKTEQQEKIAKVPTKREAAGEKNEKIPPKPIPKSGNPLPKLQFPIPKIGNPPKLSVSIPKTGIPPAKSINPKAKPEEKTDQKTEDPLPKPIEKTENLIEKGENPIPKPIEKLDNPFQKAFEKTDNSLPKPVEKAKEKPEAPFQNPFQKPKSEIPQGKTENPSSSSDQPIEKSYLKQEKPEPKTKESEKNPANDEVKDQAEDSEEKHTENTPKPTVPPRPKIFQPRPSPLSTIKAPPIRSKPPQQAEPSERAQYVAPQEIKNSPFAH